MPSQATRRMRDRGHATIAIIGTGAISEVYFDWATASPWVRLRSCAARSVSSATPMAERYGIKATTVDELLADPAIDLILNLTGRAQHHEINMAAVTAGKHVYSEKPLATTHEEAQALLDLARRQGVRVGCAPDTFLGGGHQAGRELLDSGVLGRPVVATSFVGMPGTADFAPNAAEHDASGGPLFAICPYYVTQLVTLLGPVASVVADGSTTALSCVLRLVSGCVATLTLTDARRHSRPALEIHGTEAMVTLPDPNFFGGEPTLAVGRGLWEAVPVAHRPLSAINRELPIGRFADYRGAGVDDMVAAILTDRPHRASGELAAHVLEVLEAIESSMGVTGDPSVGVAIASRVDRPAGVGDENWARRT